MKNETKDYKKQLFEMVNADICKDKMKKLRDQRKKELKKSFKIKHRLTNPPNAKRKKAKKHLLLKINNIYPWE